MAIAEIDPTGWDDWVQTLEDTATWILVVYGLLSVLIGLFLLTLGYRFFKFVVAFVGFLFGLSVGYFVTFALLAGTLDGTWLQLASIGAGLLAGIVAAFISWWVYLAGVFLLGCFCGCCLCGALVVIIVVLASISSHWYTVTIGVIMMIVGPIAIGVLAVVLVKPIIIIATSFIGASMIGSTMYTISPGSSWPVYASASITLVGAAAGIVIQYLVVPRFLGDAESVEPEVTYILPTYSKVDHDVFKQ